MAFIIDWRVVTQSSLLFRKWSSPLHVGGGGGISSSPHLPPGIVASLKKVTTPDGYLTFERFCAGLKIAMLRHDAETKKNNSMQMQQNTSMVRLFLDRIFRS